MKKFLAAALVVLFCSIMPQSTVAATRVVVYPGQNPDVNETNLGPRFQRLADGTFLRDQLGPLATVGAWSNFILTPASGLNVTVNTVNTAQLGAIYQFGASDASPMPIGYSPNLPADSTQIVILGMQSGASGSIGPMPAPTGTGLYENYLIEAQLQQVDGVPQTMPFISSLGVVSYVSVNTERTDAIVYQISSTSPGATNTTCATAGYPGADSGWIPIGWACVKHGDTTITHGVVMDSATNFVGASFGIVTFGGNYAASNPNGSASNLTTSDNQWCGQANGEALGFAIRNPAGTSNGSGSGAQELVFGDLDGNFSICGSSITVTGPSASPMSIYPVTGSFTATTNAFGPCVGGTICAMSSTPAPICSGNPNSNAVVNISLDYDGMHANPIYTTGHPEDGITFDFVNDLSTIIPNGTDIHAHYVCF